MTDKKKRGHKASAKKRSGRATKTRGGPHVERLSKTDPIDSGKAMETAQQEEIEHLIASFKSINDPSPDLMARAIAAVESHSAAKVVRARPGILKIAVTSGEKEKARQALLTLDDWDVSDEAQASMPIVESQG
jgi:hypothetical protein